MRKKLKIIENERKLFVGIFERYGIKNNWHGYPEKTVLLTDIKTKEGKLVSDHVWFSLTKGFQKLGELTKGEIIQFNARVKSYLKGYINEREFINNREIDYKLNNPSKVVRLEG